MATQDSWSDFFTRLSNNKSYKVDKKEGFMKKMLGKTKNICKNVYELSLSFIKSFFESFRQMWIGKPTKSGISKHAGKGLIMFSTLATSILTANTILRAKNLAKDLNKKTIDETKESMVI